MGVAKLLYLSTCAKLLYLHVGVAKLLYLHVGVAKLLLRALIISTPTGPSKVKLTVKGVSAVDPDSELGDSHHVLEEGKTIWNAVLGMVDITRGTNSFYKLQLLEGDHSRSFYVFRSWGRVGTTIGGTKSEVCVCVCVHVCDVFRSWGRVGTTIGGTKSEVCV